jgi:hypothetical protein
MKAGWDHNFPNKPCCLSFHTDKKNPNTMSITTCNTTWLMIRPHPALLILLLLLVGGCTLKGTNATYIFMSGHCYEERHCTKTITHIEFNEGSPSTLVDNAIGSAFTACITEGSNGTFMNIDLEHNTGTNLQMRQQKML